MAPGTTVVLRLLFTHFPRLRHDADGLETLAGQFETQLALYHPSTGSRRAFSWHDASTNIPPIRLWMHATPSQENLALGIPNDHVRATLFPLRQSESPSVR